MKGAQGDHFTSVAAQAGVAVSAEQRDRLGQFAARLLEWNRRINLTGASSLADLWGEHFPDALAMAALIPRDARVVDVGSGGGLPAVPFGVLRPDVQVLLVEPRQKRVAFLRTAVRELGLGFGVEAVRLEALHVKEAFDAAASRATFSPAEWVGLARDLVRGEGRILVFAARAGEGRAGAAAVEGAWAAELAYATAAGHPRWAGAFVPRGTISRDVPRGTSGSAR